MSDSANLTPDNETPAEGEVAAIAHDLAVTFKNDRPLRELGDADVALVIDALEHYATTLREKAARDAAPADLATMGEGDSVLLKAKLLRVTGTEARVIVNGASSETVMWVPASEVHPAAPPAQPASHTNDQGIASDALAHPSGDCTYCDDAREATSKALEEK